MADKKLFSKVRKLVVVGTIASIGALAGCSSMGKPAEKSCGGRRMDANDFNKSCGSKSCGAKSCGAKSGAEKSCGQKSCGQKSCGK